MLKLVKYLLIAVFLIIAVVFGLILTTDVNQYKPQIIELVKNTTQREFDIAGELKLAPSLIPTIKVSDVSFGNAAWGEKKPMLSVGDFEAEVALLPLLKKQVQINKLILNKPNILLETSADGKANWQLDLKQSESEPESDKAAAQQLALNVNEVQINDASLTYRDGKTGKVNQLNVDEISAQSSGGSSPLELLVRASLNGAPVKVDGTLGSLDNIMSDKESPVELSIELDKASLQADGKISQPKSLKGLDLNFNIAIDNLSDLSTFAGKDLPKAGPIQLTGKLAEAGGIYSIEVDGKVVDASITANGKLGDKALKGLDMTIDFAVENVSSLSELAGSELPDAGPVKLKGRLTEAKGGYAIKGMQATILEYLLNGDISANLQGERPAVTASLSTDTLDISSFAGDEDAGDKAKKEKLFSKEPLPLEGLKSADAKLTFKANKLITRSMTLDNMNLVLNLNNGKLTISPFAGNLAGGSINAIISLDGSSGKTAAFNKQVTMKQVELGQLPQFKGKDTLTGGKTDLSMNITGSGASVADIMAGSNGQIVMSTGNGKLLNKTIDIAGADIVFSALSMMNPLSEQEKYTTLECGVVKFDIKDGIATTDRGIALQTTKMNVVGSGTLNFKTEAVDLAVKPKAREGLGISLGSLVDAVSIGGTLANPKPKVDSSAALKSGLTAGAAVATGGISLLAEGLFNKVTGDDSPCDTALGKTPAPKPETTEASASDTTPTENADDAIEEKKDSVENKVKDALKSLF